MNAITLRNVTRSFSIGGGAFRKGRQLVAVNDVSLSLERGGIYGIVGESGCGKSTLARMLLGLDAPTRGEIDLFGRPVASIERKERSRMVQPVFQDPYSSLNPRHTLGQIISAPLEVHDIGDGDSRRLTARQAMERVGLSPSLIHSYPGQLSGGQRQRVAIARALALEPQLLVCDEPTSALDVSVQAQIINLLQELHRTLDLTIVLISHNLGVVEHLAQRVAVMYLGRVVEEGPVESIFGDPRHPYTQALIASSPRLEMRGTPQARALLRGEFPDPTHPPSGCSFHPRCGREVETCASVQPAMTSQPGRCFACHHPVDGPVTSALETAACP